LKSKLDNKRVDLLAECNTVGAPLDVFAEQCCNHCINPECSRSLFGQSKFDRRVNTWYDRMFANVPRMDEGDPRFNSIAGQRFILINPDGPLEVHSQWDEVPTEGSQPVRPVTLPEPEPEPESVVKGLLEHTTVLDDPIEFPEEPPPVVFAPEPEPAPPAPEPEPAPPAPEPVKPVPEIQTVKPEPQWADLEAMQPTKRAVPPPPAKNPRSRAAILANTPTQGGKVLRSTPTKDAWDAPAPVTQTPSGEVIVKPGAKVKLGDS